VILNVEREQSLPRQASRIYFLPGQMRKDLAMGQGMCQNCSTTDRAGRG